MNCWEILKITPTVDKKEIKLAYAALLKQHKPDDNPEQFKKIREAFETALKESTMLKSGTKKDIVTKHEEDYATDFDQVKDINKTTDKFEQNSKFENVSVEDIINTTMNQVVELYANISDRINLDKWKALLENDNLLRLDIKELLSYNLFNFIVNYPYLSGEILIFLNNIFGWTNMELEVDQSIPKDKLDFLFYRINYAFYLLPMDDLVKCDVKNIDEYIYYRENGANCLTRNDIENAEVLLNKAKDIFNKDSILFMLLGDLYSKNITINKINLFDITKAAEYFNLAFEIAPGNLQIILRLAFIELENNNVNEAFMLFEKATGISPDNLDAIRGLASCYTKLEKYEDALFLFDLCEEKSSYDLDIIINKIQLNSLIITSLKSKESKQKEDVIKLAYRYIDNDNFQQAINILNEIADDTDSEIYYLLGMAYKNVEGAFEAALTYFTKSIVLAEKAGQNGYDALNERAQVYYNSDQFDLAIADLLKVLELNPNNAYAADTLADCYRIQGDGKESTKTALTWSNKAIELDPDRWFFRQTRAYINNDLKNYADALKDLNIVISKKYYAGYEHFLRGVALLNLGEYERANDDYNQAIAMNYKDDDCLYIGLSKSYYLMGDYNNALEYATEIKHKLCMLFWRGIAFYGLGNYDRAIRNFNEAIKYDDITVLELNTGIVSCNIKMNNYDYSIKYLEQLLNACENYDEYTWMLYNLAYLYCVKQNWEKAIQVLDKYFKVAQEKNQKANNHAYYHMALAFYKQGKIQEAAKCCDNIINDTNYSEFMIKFFSLLYYELGKYDSSLDLIKSLVGDKQKEPIIEWSQFLEKTIKEKNSPIVEKSDYFKNLLVGNDELKYLQTEEILLMS